MKRVTIIVLDSLGIGALPDAGQYGDAGADTLLHILDAVPDLKIPHLRALGIGNIRGAAGGRLAVEAPRAAYARLSEASKGKDTITGHWEIAGLYTEHPFKTFEKFPDGFMADFEKRIGTGTLGNYAASGTVIIEELGPAHEQSGMPIIYTSADSVFQIAANTAVIPLGRLYEICEVAREMLTGEMSVGRVIARPYKMEQGRRVRTSDRKDYAVSPALFCRPEGPTSGVTGGPEPARPALFCRPEGPTSGVPGGPEPARTSGLTLLDHCAAAGQTVFAVGKISDIFNGQGITRSVHTENNMDGVDQTVKALKEEFNGLIFTNLVDFDSLFGHRRDAPGYGRALEAFDARLPEILSALGADEMLVLCADHGNDPAHGGWDHTREAVPALLYGKGVRPADFGVRASFADIGATAAEFLGVKGTATGKSLEIFGR
ncbi:MAG: phosphopentomutase [Clostridiales Family XIII bacterium]|jgi:phosphopentomutase|nr:phosphopentomutase [Clostridiales Family XIII bacterium]